MANSIGPKQRALLVAMRNGATLEQADGRWRLGGSAQRPKRCFALYAHGYLMAEQVDGRVRYVLTTKGRAI